MTNPKGYLVSIGGAEDREVEAQEEIGSKVNQQKPLGILAQIVALTRKKDPTIEVITTASSIPDEVFSGYKKAFRKLGCLHVGHLQINSREEAEDKKLLQRIEKCHGVMFTGGDQLRLCSILGGTPLIDRIKERYEKSAFVVAGTSAGAAAMSNYMISGGQADRAYFKGEVQLSIGFGFLHEIIIDTHFDKRGRFGRLVQAIAAQPGAVGFGLGENSGIIVEKGTRFRAIGSSSVVVIDGSRIHHNSIADISIGMPISLANLTVHLMAHDDLFSLPDRTFISNVVEE